MILTIHQPDFMPWLGFFHRLFHSDKFIILDDAQFEKNGWINRNRIRTKDGWQWLTVPVIHRNLREEINKIKIDNSKHWRKKHLNSIQAEYSKAPFFKDYFPVIETAYSNPTELLFEFNFGLLKAIYSILELRPKTRLASECNIRSNKSRRLVKLCKISKVDTYLSGTGAKDYLDIHLFMKNKINIEFQNFSHPQHKQRWPGFEPHMSVIDMLFNMGAEKTIKCLR